VSTNNQERNEPIPPRSPERPVREYGAVEGSRQVSRRNADRWQNNVYRPQFDGTGIGLYDASQRAAREARVESPDDCLTENAPLIAKSALQRYDLLSPPELVEALGSNPVFQALEQHLLIEFDATASRRRTRSRWNSASGAAVREGEGG
jgi:hypothetical protein